MSVAAKNENAEMSGVVKNVFKSTIKGNIENIIFKDIVNYKKLNYICNHLELYEGQILKLNDNKYKKSYDAMSIIYKFRDNIEIHPENTEYGEVKVIYKKGKNSNGLGRYFVKNNIGIQSLPRVIRHTIRDGIYYDLDIINAQPSLLYCICKKKKKTVLY